MSIPKWISKFSGASLNFLLPGFLVLHFCQSATHIQTEEHLTKLQNRRKGPEGYYSGLQADCESTV